MKFNEDSRVKIPAILHCLKLGYKYLSSKDKAFIKNDRTNIFTDIFCESITKINKINETDKAHKLLNEINLSLENDDLGRNFYQKLINKSGFKIIDLDNFNQNTFHVLTELTYKNGEEEFRPDITLLINGLPLVFIEVKKPNNKDGILAEHKRIKTRFKNTKFRNFINVTQLMIFSNNMEYDDDSPFPVEGSFYATSSYGDIKFNYFREEEEFNLESFSVLNETDEIEVLKDNNLLHIKNSPEFINNQQLDTPTNRILTSLIHKERLAFFLEYGIAFLKDEFSMPVKHIMRYPQFFATKAISKKLELGIKKGIIWHTQGSGKTALAFYNVKYLSNFFQKKGKIAKFYFIVDRLDLLIQASKEFRNRGLYVHNISSREDFANDIKKNVAIHNSSGLSEITVVNIQKFKDDKNILKVNDYNLEIQRVFFLDEVHRSYKPTGSFLANLEQADRLSIKIGLTGTPIIGKDFNSKSIFGDYIHKYYYNASIKDGYTLRLIREEIETSYRYKLQKALEEIEILKGNAEKKVVFSHEKFVEPLLDYIVKDFETSRLTTGDLGIGAMIVCDSADQARKMFQIFNKKYNTKFIKSHDTEISNSSALILHDEGDKESRSDHISAFKAGKIHFLFVYNMLLTGFDAERLKKLYLCRVIKAHNLLQTLTRVNRPFNKFEYGYVIDFADIEKEFEKTNRNYLEELQSELGDELSNYSNLFKSESEIKEEIEIIKDSLFQYDTSNAEIFSRQINEINKKEEIITLVNALKNARNLYNIIRVSGKYEILKTLDFEKLKFLYREASNRMAIINMKEALENNIDTTNLINTALEDIMFAFTKIKEEELVLADELKRSLQRTRESLGGNFDPKDPIFVSLKEELERLFKKRNLTEVSKKDMEKNISVLDEIFTKAKNLNRKNQLLKAKYNNDEKYARLHKRLLEKEILTINERKLHEVLSKLKCNIDKRIEENTQILSNESFVEKMMMRLILNQFQNKKEMPITPLIAKSIKTLLVREYMNEFEGQFI